MKNKPVEISEHLYLEEILSPNLNHQDSKTYGPIPKDVPSSIKDFRIDLAPDEEIENLVVTTQINRIRSISFRTNKRSRPIIIGGARVPGEPTRNRQLERHTLTGTIKSIRVVGGIVQGLGLRVTAISATNDVGFTFDVGYRATHRQKEFTASIESPNNEKYFATLFGRANADVDQLGIVIRRK